MIMKLQKAGKYVVYSSKSYQFKIQSTYITIYGDETDNFTKHILDHEIVNTSLGERRIDYDIPVTIYRKNVSFSEITNAYDLRYQARYQGEVFGALTDPDSPIVALVINSPEQSKGISGFVNYSKGEWVKEVDISEVTLIPIKTPIDLSQYLPKS